MKRGKSNIKGNTTGTPEVNTNALIPRTLKDIHTFESLIQSRLNYSSALGESYGGDRNLYQALGYKAILVYTDYLASFKRGDIGKTLIEKEPHACWSNAPTVTDEKPDSEFEKAYEDFVKEFALYSTLLRADKLMSLDKYGVVFLGFNDVTSHQLNIEVTPSESLKLLYIRPYSDYSAKIHKLVTDTKNPRFGLPEMYQITIVDTYNSLTGSASSEVSQGRTMLIHHSRIIHLLEDPLENEIEGTPKLEAVFNRLQDLDKILGGSAEMFWRNGVPGKTVTAKENYTMGTTDKEELQTQFDEYENNLRRWLTLQGVDVGTIETPISDPKNFAEIQLMMISIVMGWPKRILMGSERGELSSSQDQVTWNNLIQDRQEDLCTPVFLRPLIDKLIAYKILPEPFEDTYMINWPKLIATGEKEKSDINLNKMKTVKEYVSAPGADILIPPDIFLRDIMEYDQAQIDEIKEQQGELPPLEDDEDIEEEV